MLIASVIGVGAIVVVAVVGGAVGLYLFLRANPKKKAVVDAEVNKIATKL